MEQFKILTDLREYIKLLECGKGKVLARPIPEGGSPVFSRNQDVKEGTTLINGIQKGRLADRMTIIRDGSRVFK